jgi:hypothetical protein
MAGSTSKLLNHPDREEIVKKLLDGISPKIIVKWLEEKYPDPKDIKYRVTIKPISDFRKKYLNIDQKAARMLKNERLKKEMGIPYNKNTASFIAKKGETEQERDHRINGILLATPTYREKLKEITDAQLDAPKLMKEMLVLLNSRIEVYYDEIRKATTTGETLKADKTLIDYIRLATDVLKESKKVWDDYNSIPDEGVIDLDIVHEQVGIIRDTVKELLAEFSPELALEFMDRLNKKLTSLKYEVTKPADIVERVEAMTKRIKEIQEHTSNE